MNQVGPAGVPGMEQWLTVTQRLGENLYVATPKQGFAEHLASVRQKQEDSYTAQPPVRTVSELTKGELQAWGKKYDLEHMTKESYSALLDELVSAGVLNEQDKHFLGAPSAAGDNGMRSMSDSLGSYVRPAGQKELLTLEDAGGNLFQWADFRASIQGSVTGSGATSAYGARSAALFTRLAELLGGINAAR